MTPAGRPRLDRLVGVPVRRSPGLPAAGVEGTGLDGGPLRLAVHRTDGWHLLVFVSSNCAGCGPLWALWGRPGMLDELGACGVASVVAVTRDGAEERPDVLRGHVAGVRTTAQDVPGSRLVQSSAAWAAYRVLGPPFFVLVDGTQGVITTEGVAWSAEQVAADVARCLDAARRAPPGAPANP